MPGHLWTSLGKARRGKGRQVRVTTLNFPIAPTYLVEHHGTPPRRESERASSNSGSSGPAYATNFHPPRHPEPAQLLRVRLRASRGRLLPNVGSHAAFCGLTPNAPHSWNAIGVGGSCHSVLENRYRTYITAGCRSSLPEPLGSSSPAVDFRLGICARSHPHSPYSTGYLTLPNWLVHRPHTRRFRNIGPSQLVPLLQSGHRESTTRPRRMRRPSAAASYRYKRIYNSQSMLAIRGFGRRLTGESMPIHPQRGPRRKLLTSFSYLCTFRTI